MTGSRGVVMFAYDTDTVSYTKIAAQQARLFEIAQCPLTIISDRHIDLPGSTNLIIHENSGNNLRGGYREGEQWRNGGRYLAYELSPYQRTGVVDADFVINPRIFRNWASRSIQSIDSVRNWSFYRHNVEIDPSLTMRLASTQMSEYGYDSVWATVMIFKKSDETENLFKLVKDIENNYEYYSAMYKLNDSNFRNDYAFAIAEQIVNGFEVPAVTSNKHPVSLLTLVGDLANINDEDQNSAFRAFENGNINEALDRTLACGRFATEESYQNGAFKFTSFVGKDKTIVPSRNGLHVQDKDYLQSEKFQTTVDKIIDSYINRYNESK